MSTAPLLFFLLCSLLACAVLANAQPLPGTQPLTTEGDLAAQMVAGIDRYLMREIEAVRERRAERWRPDFSSHEAYLRSIEPHRLRFKRMIGVVDEREAAEIRVEAPLQAGFAQRVEIGAGAGYRIYRVRWEGLTGVEGEGLLLQPDRGAVADIIALPDCDWTPEMLIGLEPGVPKAAQYARRLAENGCRVLVPCLINRRSDYSGVPGVKMTNQPHREFIYRAAYEMGRHIIGYEVQKVLAAIDAIEARRRLPPTRGRRPPIGIIGYGEGGLIAFYAAACDPRIDAAVVSGYFQPREALWQEPIYRSVFGLLEEFGDAEIAALITPRALIVEPCRHPAVKSPGGGEAAPGQIVTPSLKAVEAEFRRAEALTALLQPPATWTLVQSGSRLPGSEEALVALLKSLGHKRPLLPSAAPPARARSYPDGDWIRRREKRQFEQLVEHTQHLMREAEYQRAEFWKKADGSSLEKWQESSRWYRDYFWEEIIGRLPPATLPANPRTRLVYDTPHFRGYEVMLDVYPDVFAYGILLVPNDIKPEERRPVVVCQHGLEGRPQDVADPAVDSPYYHRFACRLAERGFIAYAPQNPYIGEDRFRVLLRKAQPLKKTLFSFIVRQHERTLEWLGSLPFVDPKRIAFYGLSYGGKTAMRVPALLEGYCLSICSADYNEWIWKTVSARARFSYLLTGEYDMLEWNLGNTFNYAEMSWLILPRPFMVERGHDDGVAPSEWVAYEFSRTRERYDRLGIGARAEIEFFNGPHTIHGVGTFDFLHRHLNWPKTPSKQPGK